MNRIPRVLVTASLLCLSLSLAACGSFDNLPSVPDPTDFFGSDFFSSKKKLTGERKPVFPEGVPGVSQGVPPDLVRGNQQQQQQQLVQNPDDLAPAEPKSKARPKPKPKVAARAAPPPPPPDEQPQPTSRMPIRPTPSAARAATPWPDSPPTAPQAAPAPVPAGSPPGQIMWPDPPPPPSR
jgi:hypothetical protein